MSLPIRDRRKKLKLSVDKAAHKANLTVSMWYKIESGDRVPHLPNAKQMADTLEWTLDEFFLAVNDTQSAKESAAV